MYLLLGYGHVTKESSELNGSCDSWVHVRVESRLFANEIEKSSLEIQYRRLKSLTERKIEKAKKFTFNALL